jgi:hypothetical protein
MTWPHTTQETAAAPWEVSAPEVTNAVRLVAPVAQLAALPDEPQGAEEQLVILLQLPSLDGCFGTQLLASMSILAELPCTQNPQAH